MKKLVSAFVALMLAVPSFAQFASGGFELDKSSMYYGLRFGVSLGKLSGDTETTLNGAAEKMDYSGVRTGFTLGGVVGLRISTTAPVFLESGLYYTQRGGKDGKYSAQLNCLEIPLLVKYGIKATDDIALLPFLGPYFAYGIAGDTEYREAGTGDKGKERSYKHLLNRNDMGLKIGCGAEYNMLYLEAGYQFGLTNISDDEDLTTRANQMFINFGVNF